MLLYKYGFLLNKMKYFLINDRKNNRRGQGRNRENWEIPAQNRKKIALSYQDSVISTALMKNMGDTRCSIHKTEPKENKKGVVWRQGRGEKVKISLARSDQTPEEAVPVLQGAVECGLSLSVPE